MKAHGVHAGYRAHGVLFVVGLGALLIAVAVTAALCSDDFDSDEARAQFQADAEKGATARGRVQYILTSESLEDEHGPSPVRIDAYFSGSPSQYRFDVTAVDDESEAPLSYFVLGDMIWACSVDASAIASGAAGGACATEGLDDGASLGLLLFSPPIFRYAPLTTDEEERIELSLTRSYARMIAGEFTRCYDGRRTVEQLVGEPQVTYWSTCFASDGKVLSTTAGREGSRGGWEATAVGDVTDTDFRLPYPVFGPEE